MNDQRMDSASDRVTDVLRTRRAIFGGGLVAALGLALEAPGLGFARLTNRQQDRKRQQRRNRRRGNRPGLGQPGPSNCDVCGGGGCRFASIQSAIDAAGNAEVIQVCAGEYKESLTIVRDVTLIGAGPFGNAGSTIDADGLGSAVTVAANAEVEIQGFTISGGKAGFGGGILNRGTLLVANAAVEDNSTGIDPGGGAGIYNDRGALTLEGTLVTDNTSLEGQGGGILNSGGTVTILGGEISNNRAGTVGGGISTAGGSVSLRSVTVTGNEADDAGGLFSVANSVVTIDAQSSVTENEPNNCVGTTAC